jgi:hypothetical protein
MKLEGIVNMYNKDDWVSSRNILSSVKLKLKE